MTFRASIGATALAAAMLTTIAGASAQDATKYPDWSGQWIGKIHVEQIFHTIQNLIYYYGYTSISLEVKLS